MLEEEDTNQGWQSNDGEEEDMILVARQGINSWGDGFVISFLLRQHLRLWLFAMRLR
jgi:hypothetical protein